MKTNKENKIKGVDSKTGKLLLLCHTGMNRTDEGLHPSNGGEKGTVGRSARFPVNLGKKKYTMFFSTS